MKYDLDLNDEENAGAKTSWSQVLMDYIPQQSCNIKLWPAETLFIKAPAPFSWSWSAVLEQQQDSALARTLLDDAD